MTIENFVIDTITDLIALHSVQLPLKLDSTQSCYHYNVSLCLVMYTPLVGIRSSTTM